MTGTPRQQEAITSHDSSIVVSAGAGTGKTYVLVNKYLDLLGRFGAGEPDPKKRLSVLDILALTFTDKAAAEMKERIRVELEKKEGDFWERARLEFLIAPVQTFHSFCSGVLREFPLEAGLEPSFTVLDERESSRILSLSFQELIHTPTRGVEHDALVSTISLVGIHNLEKMIRYLSSRPDESERFFERLETEKNAVITRWEEEIREFREREVASIQNNREFVSLVRSLLGFASMDIPADDKAMMYLQRIRPFLRRMLDAGTPDEFLDAAVSCTGEKLLGGIQKNWPGDALDELRRTNRLFTERLKKDAIFLADISFNPGEPFSTFTLRFLRDLAVTYRRFREIVTKEKKSRGGLDFTDLITYTKNLFRTHRNLVGSYYADRYRYILIDEFQDTDPTQFEIVQSIIGEPSPEVQGLFIVGDPKQSIYLFRDADVTRFREAQELVTGACAGRNIPLDVCFRSSPAIVTFVNILFSRLFHTAEKPWEFTYDPLQVSEERSDHQGSVTLMLVEKDQGISEYEAIADRIAAIVAEKTGVYEEGPRDEGGIRRFTARSAKYGDIAILIERRTHLGRYIHALAARNIPYYVHKGTGFYHRQEILDLICLVRILYRPYDDVHLAGLLRSPYIGLSDLDILRISRDTGDRFQEKLKNAGAECPEYARIHAVITDWQRSAGRLRLVPLLEQILLEAGVLAVYGGMTEGEQILSNIEKLLGIIRTREETGIYRLPDLVNDLQDAMEREEKEGEAMIDDPDLDAVRIMTIHSAKGLEFPIVFVPEMASSPRGQPDPILMDSSRDLVGVSIPDPANNFKLTKTPVYTILRRELDERSLAEKKRLLYVALTRAADHLIMSGEVKDELPGISQKTRLDWIVPAIGLTEADREAGEIGLRMESGEEVPVTIITPVPEDRDHRDDQPPFTIPPELEACHGTFARTILAGSVPEGEPVLVTDIAGRLYTPGSRERREDGAIFGSAIHDVLRGRDPDTVIREYGVDDEDQKRELQAVYARFRSLFAWSEMTGIRRENAFTVTIAGIPWTGRIDLVFRQPDGRWLVVDYKSEDCPADELGRNDAYRFQVEIYRRAAELLGMKPARGALYSLRENRLVELDPWNDGELSRVLSSVGLKTGVPLSGSIPIVPGGNKSYRSPVDTE